jgi:phage terminase small subunit
MPRGGSRPNTGGARPGAGRPRKLKLTEPVAEAPKAESETPLAFMLRVMNDPAADTTLRARMAIAAAPFVHPRAEAPSRKEDAKEAARTVGKGRLATPETPIRLIVSNKP